MQSEQARRHRQRMICSPDQQNEMDESINAFQKKQWTKYGRRMPENWIDPFEIFD